MEEQILEFRVLLIQLSNQLSDYNREQLHFMVGPTVPRKLRDDCTLAGTLHLLEFLFDRALISHQHFNYLIQIFRQIHCNDVVKRLEGLSYFTSTVNEEENCDYLSEFRPTQKHRTLSTTSTELSVVNDVIENNEFDKLGNVPIDVGRGMSCSFSSSENSYLLSQTMVSSESEPLQKSSVSQTKKNDHQSVLSIVQKTLAAHFIMLTILLVTHFISIVLFSLFFVHKCHSSSHLSPALSIDKDLTYIVKDGFLHGTEDEFIQSQSFDDAKDLMLSFSDRCIGVEFYWINKHLASIQFVYSNNRSSVVRRPSNNHQLDRLSRFANNFTLHSNEEINKVIFYERTHRMDGNGSLNTSEKKDVIVGIQFRTTKGRKSDLFGSDDGRFVAESFMGYTFRCAKGRQQSGERIEMLQLVWFKPVSTQGKTDEPLLHVLDTCSFNYISEMGNQPRHATGVESSWYDLKREFNRKGESCRPGASYYRTISVEGPFLFAVVRGTYVFYHDAGKWTQYESATNVTFGVIYSSNLHPPRQPSSTNP